VGWFRRQAQADEELEKLQLSLASLRIELDRERADNATTRQRLSDLETGRATTTTAVEPPPAPSSTAWDTPTQGRSLDDVRRLAEETAAITVGHGEDLAAVRAHLASVDARISELTQTMTNQLQEIGQQVDRLGESATGRSSAQPAATIEIADDRFDELRENQVRIANEQARFAKALHEQLAELADEWRRAGR
jgi:chromosome segregation ATPase